MTTTTAGENEGAPIVPTELHGRRRPQPLSRGDRSQIAVWYAEIDRALLAMVLALMAIGLLAVAVASPSAAAGDSRLGPLSLLWKQMVWIGSGIALMILVGLRTKLQVRRIALWGTGIGIALLFAVLLVGVERNGAQRWLGFGSSGLQPSEFLKPMFAVSVAWLLSCRAEDEDLPVFSLSFIALGLVVMLLMLQPDFGQTILFAATWLVLVFVAGLPMRGMAWLGGLVLAGSTAAYFLYDNARNRIDAYLFGAGDQHQVQRGFETISASGLIGSGPFTGTAKFRLPEAENDYIFSVIGEEFGLIACAGILILYLAIIMRVLHRLREERDQFVVLAGAGLIAQFGGQAIINMAVNLQLVPSKGMTLPFISYGGSSVWALSITTGLLLALTRRNPYRAAPVNLPGWTAK
jgi:cell division protein FtsW